MGEIRSYLWVRHYRGEASSYVLKYKHGSVHAEGRGLAFWFLPLWASIAEVPVDDRELSYLFHSRSSDYQDATAQGVITWRVANPRLLADRVDFTLDLSSGQYLKQPIEKLSSMLTQLAQQFASAYMAATPIREILTQGQERIRSSISSGLEGDDTLASMGLEVSSVRVSAVKPTADLERALEMPMRERIQQESDEATFTRRALAVEKERAIQENELQNQIELSRREEQLITQRGLNERRRSQEEAESKAIEARATAERTHIEAAARADSIRLVDEAKAEGERSRMEIYRTMPPNVMLGLAAQELAGKLQRIEHLNIAPEMFGPLLSNLVRAGTHRLEEK